MCGINQAYQNTRQGLQENFIDPWKENPLGAAAGTAITDSPLLGALAIKRNKKK